MLSFLYLNLFSKETVLKDLDASIDCEEEKKQPRVDTDVLENAMRDYVTTLLGTQFIFFLFELCRFLFLSILNSNN